MNLALISSKTTLGKAIRLPLRLLPTGAVVRIARGPARGKRWLSDAAANGYWLGFWELEKQRSFAAGLKPGDVVYEIGAHVGLYVLGSCCKVGPEGHVYAFEPLPRNVKYLRRHAELNLLSNCTVVEAAVCDSSGFRSFNANCCHSEAHLSPAGATRVPAMSIDEFLLGGPDRRPPCAIKIDARGSELEILSGGRRTLGEFAPRIFISSYSQESTRACREMLNSLGYTFGPLVADALWAEPKR